MKKSICIILSVIICICFSITVFASEANISNSGNINVAKFETAEQLHSTVKNNDIINTSKLNYSLNIDCLKINGSIENYAFDISATISTRSENGKILFYTGTETKNNYNISKKAIAVNSFFYAYI